MCVNVLSKTSFLSLFYDQPTNPLKKQPKKKPKNNRNCAPHKKKRFLEARKNNRQREREKERERERGAQTSRRDRERERKRDDKTRRRKGTEKTLFFPRFNSIRFPRLFFLRRAMKNIISSSFHRSLRVVSR